MTPGFSANGNRDRSCRTGDRSLPPGNSERILQKFGSFGIEVLENSPGLRVSSLFSTHGGVNINRTFAVVAYPDIVEPAFASEHAAIINGESIGIVFKQNGWRITKDHQYFGEIDAPADHFGQPGDALGKTTIPTAIHVYSLVVSKDGAEYRYALIAEIHHPDFLRLEDLAEIYAGEFDTHLEKRDRIRDFLAVINSRVMAL